MPLLHTFPQVTAVSLTTSEKRTTACPWLAYDRLGFKFMDDTYMKGLKGFTLQNYCKLSRLDIGTRLKPLYTRQQNIVRWRRTNEWHSAKRMEASQNTKLHCTCIGKCRGWGISLPPTSSVFVNSGHLIFENTPSFASNMYDWSSVLVHFDIGFTAFWFIFLLSTWSWTQLFEQCFWMFAQISACTPVASAEFPHRSCLLK